MFLIYKTIENRYTNTSRRIDKFISGGVMIAGVYACEDALDLPYIEGTDILMLSKFNSTIKEGKIINIQSMKSEGNIEQQE